MSQKAGGPYRWEEPFLAAVRRGEGIGAAARCAGISEARISVVRQQNARFAGELAEARAARPAKPPKRPLQWRKVFLEALAETSNITAAAARAGVATTIAYRQRRSDPAFAAKWLAALHEGYDHLELEVLGHLRNPDPQRKMEVAVASRLLAAHRDAVERRRAMTAAEDEQATLDSLDAFFEGLRQRRLANEAILKEADANETAGDDGDE